MLIVVAGARGAGKTTLLDTLRDRGVTVLQPSTTRKPRFDGEAEYDFVEQWVDADYAWRIPVKQDTYGMRKAELLKAAGEVVVTVFDPASMQVFEAARPGLGVQSMTIGLDTIRDAEEQHRRVVGDAARAMTPDELAFVSTVVQRCDVVLGGDAGVVADAVMALVALVIGRGGVLTREALVPLFAAGCLLTETESASIRAASYDLRVGPEILCQGRIVELSAQNPRFEIPAYSYAIVSALEHASLPPLVIGRFDLKVSYFFEGIILSNGPQIDPGYKGALFCMLYNGSGRPKLLTFGKQFATIDFTTTTTVTEGYAQKYQLKQKMDQFVTDTAVTGEGGAIVELIEKKVAVVNRKVKNLKRNFWTVATAFITIGVLAPVLTVPIAWIELSNIHAERVALDDAHQHEQQLLGEAKREHARSAALLAETVRRLRQARLLPPAG